ncbi:MAG: phage tail tape measure protein [Tepidamorphaceae bacterium]
MFDVSFIVRLVDQFTEPAGKIYKGAEKLAKITHDFGKGFNDSLQQLDTKKLDAAIAAADSRVSKARSALLGAAGMAVTLAAPIRSAMQFEKSFASVAKNLDVSDERLRQLRGNALKISGELGIAFSSINDIMEQAASAGTPEAQLEAFTAFTAKASIAFDMMAADVGENFAYIRNLYKENQKGLEDFSDAVNHLSNNMATRAADVVNFAVRGQGAADILHLNAVQMAALGAAMKSAGIAPEVAARGVSALRNRLVKGSKGVKEAFKSIGMSYDGFMAALDKDAPKAIMELFETLGRRPEGAEALLELVGQDFSDDFSKLASNPELLSEAFGLVANKAERAGSTVREFNTQINVGLGKWDRSIAKLTAFSIGLGNILQPAFNDTIDAMSGFVDQMNVFAQAHPDHVRHESRRLPACWLSVWQAALSVSCSPQHTDRFSAWSSCSGTSTPPRARTWRCWRAHSVC